MKRITFAQFLGITSVLLLISVTVSVAWIGKLYLFDLKNNQTNKTFLINIYNSSKMVGQHFPVVSIQTDRGDTVYTDFSEKKGGLVLLFDPTSCQPCLELVLNGLQHIRDSLVDPTEFPIYALSKGIYLDQLWQYKRAFRLDYQFGKIKEDDTSLDEFLEQTPRILLINEHNTVLQCHHPIYEREQFSVIFFTKLVSRHFPPLGISTEGFEDSPLAQLKDASLLEVIEGHHIPDDPFRQ